MKTLKIIKKYDPISLFPNNTKAARFWFFTSLALCLFLIIQPYLMVEAMRIKERFIIMDEAGTFHVAPLTKFEEAAPMHDYLVSVATSALLSRGPKGLDNPPLLKQIFLEEAHRKVGQYLLEEADHFSKKKIHQKAETQAIKILKTGPKTVLAQVRGQLIRIGSFEGSNFTDVKDFILQLTLYRNPKMSSNGRLPLAVLDWKIVTRTHQPESALNEGAGK